MSVETAPTGIRAADALRLVQPELFSLRPVLVVSDFDGTLSQIVSDPWAAAILPLARRALRRLAALPGVHVALLSGRTAADVAGRVRVGGARYLGNHGLERGRLQRGRRAERMAVELEPTPASLAGTLERVTAGVARLVPEPWLIVERKPPAVAFHYRNAPDVPGAGRRVLEAVDEIDTERAFVRFPGRRVLELRPPGAVAKGDAARTLMDEVAPALCFMLGDDRSDAEAFAVLRGAREAGRTRGLALCVQAHSEAPVDVARAADVLLVSPLEAARFLSGLALRLSRWNTRQIA